MYFKSVQWLKKNLYTKEFWTIKPKSTNYMCFIFTLELHSVFNHVPLAPEYHLDPFEH